MTDYIIKIRILVHCSAAHCSVFVVLLWEGCFIVCWGGCSIPFGETVHPHDKVDEFPLAFVEDGTESQGSCRLHFRHLQYLSSVLIPLNGMIALLAETSLWQDVVVLKKLHL